MARGKEPRSTAKAPEWRLSVAKDVILLRQLGGWLRSSHSFKECVIAHQSSEVAPRMVGTRKPSAEARACIAACRGAGVGERSRSIEAPAEALGWSDGK